MGGTLKNLSSRRLTSGDYYDRSIGTQRYSGPRDYRTPYSSVSGGMTTIDPSIRAGQDSYLTKNLDLRNRYMGNQSAFRQARINPLQRQFAQGRADLMQSQGLRRVSGSSFADQALQGYDADSQRAIGEAGAQAEMEDLQALQGLDEAALNVQRDRLAQELAALGLSQQQIQQEMAMFESGQMRDMQRMNDIRDTAAARHKIVQGWAYGWMPFKNNNTGGGPFMGCYIAAFHFGTWTYEHFLIARHVHTGKTVKAKIARAIYRVLYPLFKALLKEAKHGRS